MQSLVGTDFAGLLGARTAHTPHTLLDLIAPGPGDLVVWSGSLLEGFGNEMSDIDIYVIGEDATLRPGVRSPFFAGAEVVSTNVVGKTRIDINYVPAAAVRAAVRALNAFAEFDESRTRFDAEVLEFLHRMTFAVPLGGSDLSTGLRPERTRLSTYIRAVKLDNANSYKFDSIGAARAGDWHTAIACERLRVRSLVDALLALRGETNTRFEKWRFAKLKRCGESDTHTALAFAEGIALEGRTGSLADYLTIIRTFAATLEDQVI